MGKQNETDLLEVLWGKDRIEFQKSVFTKVVFVGSNPSVKNPDPFIPFLDTRSGNTLRTWIRRLEVRCYRIINVSDVVTPKNRPLLKTEICYDTLEYKLQGDFLVVALENTASAALTRIGRDHFKLPHPSSKNRLLNDFQLVDALLIGCKKWLER